jgi:hypothetical protein
MIVYVVIYQNTQVDGVYTSVKRAEKAMQDKYPDLYHCPTGVYYTGDNDNPAQLQICKRVVNAKLTNL